MNSAKQHHYGDTSKFGSLIGGHFCYSCLQYVDPAERSKENPAKTDWCRNCGHRAEGINSTAIVGDWLILRPTNITD